MTGMELFFKNKKILFKVRKRRAVSGIITSLLLILLTVVGGIFIWNFVLSSNLTQISENISSNEAARSIKLTGYDARDSGDLSGILTLDNSLNQQLCTNSCIGNPNQIPANSGTEFIVLKIRNDGSVSTYLDTILVNNIIHVWDSSTANVALDASSDPLAGESPRDGQYSIISISNTLPLTQQNTTELNPGGDRRIVIKLSASINPDIQLNSAIRIIIDAGRFDPFEFYLSSGSTQ